MLNNFDFHVGDVVCIKSMDQVIREFHNVMFDGERRFAYGFLNRTSFTEEMNRFAGRVFTITNIYSTGRCKFAEYSGNFSWSLDFVEHIADVHLPDAIEIPAELILGGAM